MSARQQPPARSRTRDEARPHGSGREQGSAPREETRGGSGTGNRPRGGREGGRDGGKDNRYYRSLGSEAQGKAASKGAPDGWLFGRHAVEAALANRNRNCRRLLGTSEALSSIQEALDSTASIVVPEMVERSVIDSLLGAATVHQGLALRVDPLPAVLPEDIVALASGKDNVVVIVLDQVTDPHNVGAVLRSAAAFGAVAVMVQDRHSPDESGVLAKAASGTLERMPLLRVPNLVRALDIFKAGGFWVAGLAADAPTTIAEAGLSGKMVLCLGSEGEGLRRLTRENCDVLVRLPMEAGAVESLNVSNAAAVALYAVRHPFLKG